jgi:alpha-N-arabinofuranosidase
MRAGDLVEEDIRFTDEILRFFTSGRRKVGIAFDEWGVWHPEAVRDCAYEAPNTLRDAVAAAGVLDVFHRWCGALAMTNLAQTVNVLQCLVQTREDRCWLTPTYHLFDLYKPHAGATALRCLVECDSVDAGPLDHLSAGSLPLMSATASAVVDRVSVSMTNRSSSDTIEVSLDTRGILMSEASIRTLTADSADAVNSLECPDRVKVSETRRSMSGATAFVLLPHSVTTVFLEP